MEIPNFNQESLGGSDDNDDIAESLASIKSAELMEKAKIGPIVVSTENFNETRNEVGNLMKDNERITGDMLEITDKDPVDDGKMAAKILAQAQ
jgi:hypothetical protein